MELSTAIKRIIESGKIEMGVEKVLKNISEGKSKIIIISSNCPDKKKIEERCKIENTPYVVSKLTSLQLGEACGKPFLVSCISVLDTGSIDIKELIA